MSLQVSYISEDQTVLII